MKVELDGIATIVADLLIEPHCYVDPDERATGTAITSVVLLEVVPLGVAESLGGRCGS